MSSARRHSAYRLTDPAAANLSSGGREIAAFGAAQGAWDGWWTLVVDVLARLGAPGSTRLR